MTSKELLGRKILDLIEENKIQIKENEEVVDIDLSLIKPNPHQPRVNFESAALKSLAASIKEHGVLQPVLLKPSPDGFTIVAGERRVRASKIAGKKSVPAIIRDYNSKYLTELAILENLQREDLSPIEEAVAYERAIKNLGLTQAELGKKIGKSRSYITNMLGLLNLPLFVIDEVNKGTISMGHARVLSKLDDSELIDNLAQRIIKEGLNVRRIEEIARKKKSVKRQSNNQNVEYEDKLLNSFKRHFDYDYSLKIKASEITLKFKSKNELKEFLNNMEDKNER